MNKRKTDSSSNNNNDATASPPKKHKPTASSETCTVFHAADETEQGRSLSIYYNDDTHSYRFSNKPTEEETKLARLFPVVSVTTFIRSFFHKFNAVATAQRMVNAASYDEKHASNPDALLYNCVTETEITNRWKENANTTASKGTAVHAAISDYMRSNFPGDNHEAAQFTTLDTNDYKAQVEMGRRTPEFALFLKRHLGWFQLIIKESGLGTNLDDMCYICEIPVGSRESLICGTPDLIIANRAMQCVIIDWKTGKKALDECTYTRRGEEPRKGTGPCSMLLDNELHKTALQLALYNSLVSNCHKFTVLAMFAIQINDELPPPKFVIRQFDNDFKFIAEGMLLSRSDTISKVIY
jgi:hypothetical protein